MNLAWGAKVSAEFRDKVMEICRGFGWSDEHASWLMACMAFESAETFSPSVKNAAGSGATGLIQFMPSTAVGLGTSVYALSQMTTVEQLDKVREYFKPYASRIGSLSDMYMAILLPSFIGRPNDAILFSYGTSYRQNAGLDENSDGKITKAEACARVEQKLTKGLQPGYAYSYVETAAKPVDESVAGRISEALALLDKASTILKTIGG